MYYCISVFMVASLIYLCYIIGYTVISLCISLLYLRSHFVLKIIRIRWETYWEKISTEESGIYGADPTWDFFVDAVKEQYYPVGNYEDQYMRWTTLWQERGQEVPEFTNTFHTLHTKLGIKDSERHLVLKYHGALHRYIQTEMNFFDISSLGVDY
jgi:hypothetical protein